MDEATGAWADFTPKVMQLEKKRAPFCFDADPGSNADDQTWDDL